MTLIQKVGNLSKKMVEPTTRRGNSKKPTGEMVVGWQYIPAPHKGVTIGSSLRQDVAFRPDWFYFGQDGVLQEFVGKQVLEAKTATNTNKHYGE